MDKLLYIVCCMSSLLGGAWSCPYVCICNDVVVDSQSGVDVDCSLSYQEHLPSHIPEGAVKLDFSFNRLGEIPTSINRLTELRELDLSKNRLRRIGDNLFSSLISLKVLNLSNNHLSELTQNAFKGLSRLEKLDLHENIISQLPMGMLQSLSGAITVVCLEGNPWDCDRCEFRETLKGYLSYEQNNLTNFCNREVPTCAQQRAFTEVNLEEIPECPEGKPITTSLNFISTTSYSSTELSKNSLNLTFSENPQTTVSSLPNYVHSEESIVGTTSEVGFPSNRFVSGKDVTKGDSQVLIAVAIVILGVMLLIIFLVFSIILWKMQRNPKKDNVSCRAPSMDALGMVSPWPLLQGRQLPTTEEPGGFASSQFTEYEEIPCTAGENFDGYVTSRDVSKTESEQSNGQPGAAKKDFEPYSVRIDNSDFTLQYKQPNPSTAKLPRAVDNERIAIKCDSSDTTENTDLSGSTPYMEMRSPKGGVVVKDLYAPLNT